MSVKIISQKYQTIELRIWDKICLDVTTQKNRKNMVYLYTTFGCVVLVPIDKAEWITLILQCLSVFIFSTANIFHKCFIVYGTYNLYVLFHIPIRFSYFCYYKFSKDNNARNLNILNIKFRNMSTRTKKKNIFYLIHT